MEFDKENKNDFWAQAERLEIWESQSLQSFQSIGKKRPPRGHKMIPIFFVYDVKEDFRLKARMAAGGHVLPPPLESVCSGVVSLRSIRLICFIAELNGLDLYQGDISNACLESYCAKLLAFTAGPEFGELEGHAMLCDCDQLTVLVSLHPSSSLASHAWCVRAMLPVRCESNLN